METAETQKLIGVSKSHREIIRLINKYATTDKNILIIGNTGTGKELIAREIHRQSNRSNKPFVDVNCAAIPGTLLESELFGYEAGAFTDARKRKIGLLEHANGGTMLLDEIGDMNIHIQAKFLRMLEDGHIRHLGGTDNIPIDVRFIFSTNRDLGRMVADETFREDLFYRLNDGEIHITPLRDRREDVIAIFHHYTKGRIDPWVKASIYSSELRGNVRELKTLSGKEYREIENSMGNGLTKHFLNNEEMLNKFCTCYEICTLRAAGVSKDEISKTIYCRRALLSDEWQNAFGISLDDFIGKYYDGSRNRLFFPDFTTEAGFTLVRRKLRR